MRAILVLPAAAGCLTTGAQASGACALLLRLGPDKEPRRRDAARACARDFLEAAGTWIERRPALFVQIAPIQTAESEADLDAVAAPGLAGVFLEGCGGRADVQQLAARLAVREAALGLPEGDLRIIALAAQTPAGVFSLGDYGGASPRLAALAMDEAPLPGGVAARGVARALLVVGAAAAGLPALDVAPRAEGGAFEEACRAVGREGFAGLMTPHAEEVPTIARALA